MDCENFKALLQIYKKHESPKKREMARDKLVKHQDLLEQIALFEFKGFAKAPLECVIYGFKNVATELIENEDVLAKIALESSYDASRLTAIRNPNLKDDEVLSRVAFADEDADCREEAVMKIQNEDILADIAVNCRDNVLRVLAVERIESHEVLNGVVMHGLNNSRRIRRRMRNRKYSGSSEYLSKNPDPRVRARAVSEINDEDILRDVLRYDESPLVREAAIKRIDSQEVFIDRALHDSSFYVLQESLRKLNNKNVLKDVSDNMILYSGFFFRSSIKEAADRRLNEINSLSKSRQLKLLEEK